MALVRPAAVMLLRYGCIAATLTPVGAKICAPHCSARIADTYPKSNAYRFVQIGQNTPMPLTMTFTLAMASVPPAAVNPAPPVGPPITDCTPNVEFAGLGAVTIDTSAVPATRSEERRVGKECRSRWSP